MKHNTELRTFLGKYVNINSWRLDTATNIVSTTWEGSLIKYLTNNLWETFWCVYQWSFAYETITKPDPNSDGWKYDVDVAIRLKYRDDWDWEEHKYHDLILDCLKESDRYKDKIDESKERAIRVQYDANDGEFFVDLVPMFHDWGNWNVVDRKTTTVEISWGTEFRDWVNAQNNKTSIEGSTKKFLKEVIRLYKFLRNKADPDLIRSVQLTLLLARQIDKLDDEDFIDLTTIFHKISINLKSELDWIAEVSELDLSNPWLSEEIFNRNFTDEQFQVFKAWIIDLSWKIEEAYIESDEDKSIEKWINIFWEKFSSKKDISKSFLPVVYQHAESPMHKGWVRLVNRQRIKIIWKKQTSDYSRASIPFDSDIEIRRGLELSFYAKPIEKLKDCEIYWQVTNQDNQYVHDKRWQIGNSINMGYTHKWYFIQESSMWPWKHWVKCYMVNSQNQIVWESDQFNVNIH